MTQQTEFIRHTIETLARAYREHTGLDGAYDQEMVDADRALQTIWDIETLEVENRMMRERNERIEAECVALKEERDTAIRAYRELIIKQESKTK
jgi:hypothetical protein